MAEQKEKILIVDDEPSVLRLVNNLLKEEYTIKTVENGKKALDSVGTFKPDLVLLDMMMPALSGVEVCRKLRADSKTKNLRVVFLTVVPHSKEGVDVLKELRALDYITKPFEAKDFIKRVKEALKSETPHPEDEH